MTALLAERGCDYLVALLGILKANQIYLPLDPRDPHQRLRWTIEQSEAKTILASVEFLPLLAQIVATLAPARRPTILALAATPPEAPPSSGIAPPAYAPRQPAYVMYTSGSTGTPKGAMVGQAGMVNHLLAKITALGLCADGRRGTRGFAMFRHLPLAVSGATAGRRPRARAGRYDRA